LSIRKVLEVLFDMYYFIIALPSKEVGESIENFKRSNSYVKNSITNVNTSRNSLIHSKYTNSGIVCAVDINK
jgi:hypothetical protein